ncbi:MAG: pirin family protein [Acidimicrobiia bacterium]|nr:pirin family protein [Acidimicrobiia bacterium]MBV9043051.1 pirin family protein [Acidimicrobiia bacterium]MBV9285429.1 pirin family protein [Acidimicrobiia bacterium]
MSGPVTDADAPAAAAVDHDTAEDGLEILDSREAKVGNLQVRRALPRRTHRTVGAWCFADHAGPVSVDAAQRVDIGPHPHMGLQTVTWLVAGELVHRDSLGSEQEIRPGQLNLMTAGQGVAHAEETAGGYEGLFHGIQLWVAQPDETRHGDPAFEHHAELPQLELDGATATVFVGDLGAAVSPARRDTQHVGAELAVRGGRATLPVRRDYEHALIVLDGKVSVDGRMLEPGHLGYLGLDRDEVVIGSADPATVILLGGVPFPEPIFMWWNFVGRSQNEMDAAYAGWQEADNRFGAVHSELARVPAPRPQWSRQP